MPVPASDSHLSLLLLVVVGVSFAGRDTLSESSPQASSGAASPGGHVSQEGAQKFETRQTPPLKHVDRLTNDVEVRGSLKPDRPLTITLTATSHLQTKNVKARLYLPKLSVLRRGPNSPGDPEVPSVGEKLPAVAELNRGMGEGQSVRKQVTVRPEKPGYYMVNAAMWAPDAEHLTSNGVPIDNS